MNPHGTIDRRSLEMDRCIAARLRKQPFLLDRAKQTLDAWLATADPAVLPALEEWHEILRQPLSDILRVVEGEDQRSVRLRQSSPFCGILTPAERTRILLAGAHESRAA
jgi:hypothetical protein